MFQINAFATVVINKYINVNKPIIVKNIKFINKNFLRIDRFLRKLFSIN